MGQRDVQPAPWFTPAMAAQREDAILAKCSSRFLQASRAHNELIATAYQAQVDALLIESQAKKRLADEYHAAKKARTVQDRERPKNVPAENILPTASDLGLTRKDILERRQLRDAESAEPGIVKRVLDQLVGRAHEPTTAAVRRTGAAIILLHPD